MLDQRNQISPDHEARAFIAAEPQEIHMAIASAFLVVRSRREA